MSPTMMMASSSPDEVLDHLHSPMTGPLELDTAMKFTVTSGRWRGSGPRNERAFEDRDR
jgi:hypothetical protein